MFPLLANTASNSIDLPCPVIICLVQSAYDTTLTRVHKLSTPTTVSPQYCAVPDQLKDKPSGKRKKKEILSIQ